MSRVTDVDGRAQDDEAAAQGRRHQQAAERTVDIALAHSPLALRVLDIGCCAGFGLEELVLRLPNALEVVGVERSAPLLAAARERAEAPARVVRAAPDRLPFADAHFDLVVSCLSFDGWDDQQGALREAARVLAPGGRLVVADRCAFWLPGAGEGRARTPRRFDDLARTAGLTVVGREPVRRLAGLPHVQASILSR